MEMLKPFQNLTDEEILELTDETIQAYKDLACAEAGVPFVPPVPKKPDAKDVLPDLKVCEFPNNFVVSPEDAAKIIKFIKENQIQVLQTTYCSGPGYNRKVFISNTDFQFEDQKIFSVEHWDKFGKAKTQYDTLTAEYEKAKEEREKILDKRETETGYIDERINEIYQNQCNKERYTSYFNQYLEMAQGNKTVAMNFLRRSYPGIEDYPELIEQLGRAGDSVAGVNQTDQ
jgi:predicted SnoaL-like aldol condensation-catalyzing enzyme